MTCQWPQNQFHKGVCSKPSGPSSPTLSFQASCPPRGSRQESVEFHILALHKPLKTAPGGPPWGRWLGERRVLTPSRVSGCLSMCVHRRTLTEMSPDFGLTAHSRLSAALPFTTKTFYSLFSSCPHLLVWPQWNWQACSMLPMVARVTTCSWFHFPLWPGKLGRNAR